MTAEILTEIYRTDEDRSIYKFSAVVTLSYFGDTCMLMGLSGGFSVDSWRELYTHLQSRGVTKAVYYRRGKLKEVIIKQVGTE